MYDLTKIKWKGKIKMDRKRIYVDKGNVELDPNKNPQERILYYYDEKDAQIYSDLEADLKNKFCKNILISGNRGSGKSSLINAVLDVNKHWVIKVDCSLVDEIEDILILIVNEINEKINFEGYKIAGIESNIKNIIYTTRYISKNRNSGIVQTSLDKTKNIQSELNASLKIINFKGSVLKKLNKLYKKEQEKEEELMQEKVLSFFERKKNLKELINKIEKVIKKKIVIIFDEIDKQENDFLEKFFNKYKTYLTSGSSTNIFIINLLQYYHIFYGNTFNSIEKYFDEKYLIRMKPYSLFKASSYNIIIDEAKVKINYLMNNGAFNQLNGSSFIREVSPVLLIKAEYYISLFDYIEKVFENLDEYIKEILIITLNKIIRIGFMGDNLNLKELTHLCSDEFSFYEKIQLKEKINYIIKSHIKNYEDICLDNENIIIKSEIKEKYRILLNKREYKNHANSWNYIEGDMGDETKSFQGKLNEGQIIIKDLDSFGFLSISDNNHAYEDIIKTLQIEKRVLAFITLKRKTAIGNEYGYLIFIDGNNFINKYVLYYTSGGWDIESQHIKRTLDNFIKANKIKEIVIEIDEDFMLNKKTLQYVLDKYNQHEDVPKDWIIIKW